MAKIILIYTCLILHTYVGGAPNIKQNSFTQENPLRISSDAKTEVNTEPKLDDALENRQHTTAEKENTRRKRMYNYLGYDFSPLPYSSPFNNAGYLAPDPYQEIYKRIQSIASTIRQPTFTNPSPPPIFLHGPSTVSQFPFFFPVVYIPQSNCKCPSQPNTTTNPEVDTRFPVTEDPNQIWGLVVNETIVEEGDGSRPISFEPIPPSRPVSSRPPPVEHGSSQAGETSGRRTTSTTSSPLTPISSLPPVTNVPSIDNLGTTTYTPSTTPAILEPTICDGAVLNCCHQRLELTETCLVTQGCPDLLRYQNPCDSQLILKVIQKFNEYYIRKLGQSL